MRPPSTAARAFAREGPDDVADDLDLDLDLGAGLDPVPAPGPRPLADDGDTPAPRRPALRLGRRRWAVAAAVVVVAGSLVVASADRHREHAEALVAAAALERQQRETSAFEAWVVQAERSRAHRAREVEALALLPADLAADQLLAQSALEGAAPRLPDLAWSVGRTGTRRDGSQRTANGSAVLVDASRFARVVVYPETGDGGDTEPPRQRPARIPAVEGQLVVVPPSAGWPATGVGWRITTPLRPRDPTEPCLVGGVVPLPSDGPGGAPTCSLRTFTSPSGEQQVLAVRSWSRMLDPTGGSSPVRQEVVHQAVLVTDGRWAWSVAASAVGTPGTRDVVPPMSVDQVMLATRWMADAARGLPTPAPLEGTFLPGFSG